MPGPDTPVAQRQMTPQFAALLLIFAVAPLPLGGNRPWAVALLGAVVFLLFACHLLWPERVDGSEAHDRATAPSRRARAALYAMGAWIVLLALQLVPLPSAVVGAMDFNTITVFPATGRWATITVDPYSTRLYLLKAIALFALFWLLLRLVTTPQRVEMLAKAVVLCGCLQAVVGIVLFAMRARYSVFFVGVEHYRASGTFVNHNHFAGYLEMSLAVGIGLMISKLDRARSRTWRQWARDWLAVLVSDKARLRVMLVIMVIGLIASRSRMGNAAFLVSLLAAGTIAMVLSRQASRSMMIFIVSLVLLDIVVIGSVVGLDKVMRRIEQTQVRTATVGTYTRAQGERGSEIGMSADGAVRGTAPPEQEETLEQRTAAARHALDMIQVFPVAGTGGGNVSPRVHAVSSAGSARLLRSRTQRLRRIRGGGGRAGPRPSRRRGGGQRRACRTHTCLAARPACARHGVRRADGHDRITAAQHRRLQSADTGQCHGVSGDRRAAVPRRQRVDPRPLRGWSFPGKLVNIQSA